MALGEVRDRSIWQKHIAGGPEVVAQVDALKPGEEVSLRVAGKRTRWAKVRSQPTGKAIAGLRPADSAASKVWAELYATQRGKFVEIALDDGGGDWVDASEADRQAAWAAFKALAAAGWRSDGATFSREDLHER